MSPGNSAAQCMCCCCSAHTLVAGSGEDDSPDADAIVRAPRGNPDKKKLRNVPGIKVFSAILGTGLVVT